MSQCCTAPVYMSYYAWHIHIILCYVQLTMYVYARCMYRKRGVVKPAPSALVPERCHCPWWRITVTFGMLITYAHDLWPYTCLKRGPVFVCLITRDSLCTVLTALKGNMNEIATTGEQTGVLSERISKLEKEAGILNDAVTSPNHPLITMQDRYDLHVHVKHTCAQSSLVATKPAGL